MINNKKSLHQELREFDKAVDEFKHEIRQHTDPIVRYILKWPWLFWFIHMGGFVFFIAALVHDFTERFLQ